MMTHAEMIQAHKDRQARFAKAARDYARRSAAEARTRDLSVRVVYPRQTLKPAPVEPVETEKPTKAPIHLSPMPAHVDRLWRIICFARNSDPVAILAPMPGSGIGGRARNDFLYMARALWGYEYKQIAGWIGIEPTSAVIGRKRRAEQVNGDVNNVRAHLYGIAALYGMAEGVHGERP